MSAARCPHCDQALRGIDLTPEGMGTCPSCGRKSVVVIFPALTTGNNTSPPALPDDPPAEGESACFYNPKRRATKECSHCGVLISDAWAAHWGSDTVCLKCLEHLREKGQDARFQGSRTLWDNIALTLSLVPFTVVLWWAIVFTAPAALFLGIRHWNSPRSMVPRGRWRLVVAILLALIQVGGLAVGAVGLGLGWFGER